MKSKTETKQNEQLKGDRVNLPFKLIDKIGYCSDKVYEAFKNQGRDKQWRKFINGSTGGVSKDGKCFLVYPWDVETFVRDQFRTRKRWTVNEMTDYCLQKYDRPE